MPPAQPLLDARLLGGHWAPEVPTEPWPAGCGADPVWTVQWEPRVMASTWDRVGEAVASRVRDGTAGSVSRTLKHGGTGCGRALVTVKTLG